jgi:type III secretion protein L
MDDEEKRPSTGAPRVIGKVIKSDAGEASAGGDRPMLRPPPRGVVNAEEFDARQSAKGIIAEAQKRADEIKAEALRFKEEVFAKARDEAKADVVARASEELARAKLQAGQLLEGMEKDVIELALKIAEKIIGRDLERQPELVVEVVASAVQATRASKSMIVRVHPEDGKLLREKRPRLMELIGRAVDIAVKEDGDVERGGCIIQTEFGTVDGQLKTQFEMLKNLLSPDGQKKESK